jgi:tripartite-type tricarboxylate transporter receptor subunit TctC
VGYSIFGFTHNETSMKRLFTIAIAALAALPAFAEYPDKPIMIVVPFAAGGPTDRVARDLAEALRKPLGGASDHHRQRAGGAGSTIGAAKVARAANRRLHAAAHHVAHGDHPLAVRKLPYKTLESDFEYLGMINDVPMTLIAQAQPAGQQLQGTARLDRANKGKTNLGNAGIGSASHLCGLLLQSALKIAR